MSVNPQRGEVELDIGGGNRTLRYDMNAIAMLEKTLGKPFSAIFSEENVGIMVIRATLWAGLRWRNRRLTEEQVGEWMSDEPTRIEEWVTKAMTALQEACGVEVDSDAESEDIGDQGNRVPALAPAPSTSLTGTN